jgi:hypothetical protein
MTSSIFYQSTTLAPPVYSPVFKILFSQWYCCRLKSSGMLCSAEWKTEVLGLLDPQYEDNTTL